VTGIVPHFAWVRSLGPPGPAVSAGSSESSKVDALNQMPAAPRAFATRAAASKFYMMSLAVSNDKALAFESLRMARARQVAESRPPLTRATAFRIIVATSG